MIGNHLVQNLISIFSVNRNLVKIGVDTTLKNYYIIKKVLLKHFIRFWSDVSISFNWLNSMIGNHNVISDLDASSTGFDKVIRILKSLISTMHSLLALNLNFIIPHFLLSSNLTWFHNKLNKFANIDFFINVHEWISNVLECSLLIRTYHSYCYVEWYSRSFTISQKVFQFYVF